VFDIKDQYVISLWDGAIYPGRKSYASKFGKSGLVITCEVNMTTGFIGFKQANKHMGQFHAPLMKSGEWLPTIYIRANDAKLSIVHLNDEQVAASAKAAKLFVQSP